MHPCMTTDQHTYHGEEPANGPDEEGHVDATGGGQHARRGHEDPAPNDTACSKLKISPSFSQLSYVMLYAFNERLLII